MPHPVATRPDSQSVVLHLTSSILVRFALCLLPFAFPLTAPAQLPAFPGAQGAGAYATGGRGGSIYRVTTTNATGPGSITDAISQPNRIIVFTTSGYIDLAGKTLKSAASNLTIAGQSAPGEGICFRAGALSIRSNNVILTHLRFRRGYITDGDTGDSVAADPDTTTTNLLFAHLSASWATDENLTMSKPNLSTIQYCIASEGLDYTNDTGNPPQTPPNHSEGSLWGTTATNGRVSLHHSLYAHNRLRNPRTTSFDGATLATAPINDFRNNVIYNWKERASHTGSQLVLMNWLSNYFRPGPSTFPEATNALFTMENNHGNKLHLAGNILHHAPAATSNNWLAVAYRNNITETEVRTNTPFLTPPVTTQPTLQALTNVLQNAGATLPARDSVDLRIITDVLHGTGRVPDKETDLPPHQRWPNYRTLPAPLDTDADGLPDYWELQFGLNPNSPADSAALTPSGYANIEHYLNNTHPTNGPTPIVYIHAAVSRARAGSALGQWWITRTGPTNQPLTIHYTITGDALPATNYTTLPGQITIPTGQDRTALYLNPTMLTNGTFSPTNLTGGATTIVTLQTGNTNWNVGCPNQSLIVIRPAPDTDADGLPNDWETNYFGNITNANPTADPDLDGYTNQQEYQAGTNPTNSLDHLKILSVARTNNELHIRFATAPGRRYALDRRDDLSGSAWNPAVTNIGDTGEVVTSAPIPTTSFYRIRLDP